MHGHTARHPRRLDRRPKGFSGPLLGVYQGNKLMPIGRVGTGYLRRLLRWLEPGLKQLETDVSPFSAPIPRKPGRIVHWASQN
jgi:bifunctional non-homologous end joining protein LigD